MDNLRQEIEKRRTFAIISHPDAGKTTLTEKFLLYGGAINQAGSVKGKATAKHAVSDWMEIDVIVRSKLEQEIFRTKEWLKKYLQKKLFQVKKRFIVY